MKLKEAADRGIVRLQMMESVFYDMCTLLGPTATSLLGAVITVQSSYFEAVTKRKVRPL